jgi:hypothetical protein
MIITAARIIVLVCFVLAAVSGAATQNKRSKQKAEDPVVQTVESLLQQSSAFSTGFSEKQSARLGDQVTTALLKIFNAKEIEDSDNVRRFLPIIHSAFLFPNLIPQQYRRPSQTSRLLFRLERQVTDPQLRQQTAEMRRFVWDQFNSVNDAKPK